LADQDHVFFEYRERHTSDAVCDMFRGYSGYVHADASAIYDSLFRGAAVDRGPPPTEVACWAHARRKFWEAATAHSQLGREGLLRIRALYELEAKWAELPPIQRREFRQAQSRPLLDSFFTWVEIQRASTQERGLEHTALHYVIRQEQALRRFLEDGRLRLDNNASERALRPIAIGRKNWLFFGSDSHAESAANVFSLVASCKLHGIEPERYFTEVIRLLPYWPKTRLLELAPKYWVATRSRLDGDALARELGPLEIPAARA
jgi:hypothetical protein